MKIDYSRRSEKEWGPIEERREEEKKGTSDETREQRL